MLLTGVCVCLCVCVHECVCVCVCARVHACVGGGGSARHFPFHIVLTVTALLVCMNRPHRAVSSRQHALLSSSRLGNTVAGVLLCVSDLLIRLSDDSSGCGFE